jgi:5-formyltetrahydrofolate cyclo-ligase
MNPVLTKQTWRERMRDQLKSLSSSDVAQRSASIWERLAVLTEFVSAQGLLIYVSRGNEVATHGLIRQLLAMGKRVTVPSFDGAAGHYVASELTDFDGELVGGRFGILEPGQTHVRAVDANKLDALLVPGLAFDGNGNRIGRGMGFFDRLLREARGTKIALAYDFQLLNEVPADAHDVRMDFIVTEKRVVSSKGIDE